MRSKSIEISNSEDSTLVQSWIGCWKKYSVESVPAAVRAHIQSLLVVPPDIKQKLPAPSLPLGNFLAFSKSLPKPDGRLVTVYVSPFSKEAPDSSTVRHLWMRGVPFTAFVDDVAKQVCRRRTSNIVIRVYFPLKTGLDHFHTTAVPNDIPDPYRITRYALISPQHFLFVLRSAPDLRNGSKYILGGEDAQSCRDLVASRLCIGPAIKNMSPRSKKIAVPDIDSD